MMSFPELPLSMPLPRASRILHRTHYVQLAAASLVFILCIVRLCLRTQRIGVDLSQPSGGPASGWGTGVAAKSIIFLGYPILTETQPRCRRWASLKTNMVLNVIEVAFWWALAGITAGSLGSCIAPMCALNSVILVLCLSLALAGLPVAYVSIVLFQNKKRSGVDLDLDPAREDSRDMTRTAVAKRDSESAVKV